MGADFLFGYFIAPVERAEDLQLDFNTARQHIDDTDWNLVPEIEAEFENQAGNPNELNRVAREALHGAVGLMGDLKDRRDVGWLCRNGETIFISGGMSWGDIPTGMYYAFNLLALSGLDKVLLGKHAPEQPAGTNGITIHLPPLTT
ncbi:MAG: hypothetical protein HS108_14530 [Planctomycetes bacterium]|nr:hypothetical protein [Planctomycetota bacterium]